MRKTILALVGAASLGGCMDNVEDISVADMKRDAHRLDFSVFRTDTSNDLFVTLNVVSGDLRYCHQLAADVRGSVGGVPMEVFRGIEDGTFCTDATMSLANPPELDDAEFVLSDSHDSVTCHLRDVLAPRHLVAVSPAAWTFQPGQRVTVRTSADDISYEHFERALEIALRPVGAAPTASMTLPATADESAGVVAFDVPATLAPGRYELEVSIAPRPQAQTMEIDCDPFPAEVETRIDVRQEITVAP